MNTKGAHSVVEAPTFEIERSLWMQGFCRVAGIDEAGRGALAGPVVAAAVIVAPECADEPIWASVRDSKLLSPVQRGLLSTEICKHANAWAIGAVDAATIDEIGIAAATRLAMQHAVASLVHVPDYLLIDWVRLPQLATPQLARAKADRTMASVAAASILAKVHRDQIMVEQDRYFPLYGFAAHKGYGVVAHLTAIEQYGPCSLHRHTFAPIARRPMLFECHDHC